MKNIKTKENIEELKPMHNLVFSIILLIAGEISFVFGVSRLFNVGSNYAMYPINPLYWMMASSFMVSGFILFIFAIIGFIGLFESKFEEDIKNAKK